jgi:hypothetical protein
LDPQVPQGVWRLVSITDCFGTVDLVLSLIESDIDGVVDALLPVVWSWFAIGGSVRIWGWEDFLELTEFVFLSVFPVWERLAQRRLAYPPS